MIQGDLPGADVLEVGLTDLQHEHLSPEALAVCALHSRLCRCGLDVPEVRLTADAEIQMYDELGRRGEQNPHAAMNGIMRRLDAYASSAEARRFRGLDGEGSPDHLTRRIAETDRLAQARAQTIRFKLSVAVESLRKKGASQVWLFGSLVTQGHPHGQSDVDLAVVGLPAGGLIRTLLELEEILGARVDLVRLEEASESLRARIVNEGEQQIVSE